MASGGTVKNKRLYERKYLCDVCSRAFYTSANLKEHHRLHTGEKPYECKFCDKRFPARSSLTVHERAHMNVRPYVCQECGKAFISKSALNSHWKSKTHAGVGPVKFTLVKNHIPKTLETTPNELQCRRCKSIFSSKEGLSIHIRDRVCRDHECRFCHKKFEFENRLKAHTRLHTGEKPYQCHICDKMFAFRPSLVVHVRQHKKEKPFVCRKCGKAFICKSALNKHTSTKMFIGDGPCKQKARAKPRNKKELVENDSTKEKKVKSKEGDSNTAKNKIERLVTDKESTTDDEIPPVGKKLFKERRKGSGKLDIESIIKSILNDKRSADTMAGETSVKNNDKEMLIDKVKEKPSLTMESPTEQAMECVLKSLTDGDNEHEKTVVGAPVKKKVIVIGKIKIVKKTVKEKPSLTMESPTEQAIECVLKNLTDGDNEHEKTVVGSTVKKEATVIEIKNTDKEMLIDKVKWIPFSSLRMESPKEKTNQCVQKSLADGDNEHVKTVVEPTVKKKVIVIEKKNTDKNMLIEKVKEKPSQTMESPTEQTIECVLKSLADGDNEHVKTVVKATIKKKEIVIEKMNTDKKGRQRKGIPQRITNPPHATLVKWIPIGQGGENAKGFDEATRLKAGMQIDEGSYKQKLRGKTKMLSDEEIEILEDLTEESLRDEEEDVDVEDEDDDKEWMPASIVWEKEGRNKLSETGSSTEIDIEATDDENTKDALKINNKVKEPSITDQKRARNKRVRKRSKKKEPNRDSKGKRTKSESISVLAKKRIECRVCGEIFQSKQDRDIHFKIHFKCSICDKKFVTTHKVKEHYRIHTGEKPFKCEFCNKRFTARPSWVLHMKIHADTRPYICEHCGKGYIAKSALNRHMITHTEQWEFSCDICGRNFAQKQKGKDHMHALHRKKESPCLICKEMFMSKYDLNMHVKKHEGSNGKYPCLHCDREFSIKHEFIIHIRQHTGEKPFECELCKKMFSHKGVLKQHLHVHHKIRPHQCDRCQKYFSTKSSMIRHYLVHDDATPFNCEICGQCFKYKSSCKKHYFNMHPLEAPIFMKDE